MSYEKALGRVLEHEGGYSNDPRDNGGETYRGISRKWYPKWDGWVVLDTYIDKFIMSQEDNSKLEVLVADFYKRNYWDAMLCSDIESEFIAELLFNFSINMGKKVVTKKAQRVVAVTQDGVLGKQTIAAINATSVDVFVYHFLLELVEFYLQLGKKQPHYLLGWLNRTMSMYYAYENGRKP